MSYSEDVKAAALATYAEHGKAAAAREHGIGTTTITRWAREAGISLGPEMKKRTAAACASNEARQAEAAVGFGTLIVELIERVRADEKMPAQEVRALVTAAAIATDKFVALTGGRADTRRLELTGAGGGALTVTDDDRQRVEDDITAMIAIEVERIVREAGEDNAADDE